MFTIDRNVKEVKYSLFKTINSHEIKITFILKKNYNK